MSRLAQLRVLVCVVFLASIALVWACPTFSASETFIVQTLVGSDTVPPSVPTNLVATPISISQINLAWTGSTDNSGVVSGYHIWRDNTLIATTSITTYADSGLASSTSYVYYVTAFDPYMNESASSTSATGTTLSPSPPKVEYDDGSGYGSRLTPFDEMIVSMEVLPGKDAVVIRYVTRVYVRSTLQWGREISYELGSLVEETYLTRHETSIIGLTPQTEYALSIRGVDRFNREGVLYTGTFTTLPPDDVFPPENVTGLTAVKNGEDVILSWKNPHDTDFAKVRVVRSDLFYPNDTQDGWVVYEGQNEEVRDEGVATGTKKYYTVFAYDALGNVSSGAVVVIRFEGDKITIGTPENPDPTKNELKLFFDDIIFMQEGKRLYVDDTGRVYVDGTKQLTVSISYDRLPQHLKTILITLLDARNNNRTFSFLLRVNEEKTVYTSTLAPLGVDGDFPVTLSVFDYSTSQVGYTKGVLVSNIRYVNTDSDIEGVIAGFVTFFTYISNSYVMWFIILLVLLTFLSRRLMHATW